MDVGEEPYGPYQCSPGGGLILPENEFDPDIASALFRNLSEETRLVFLRESPFPDRPCRGKICNSITLDGQENDLHLFFLGAIVICLIQSFPCLYDLC